MIFKVNFKKNYNFGKIKLEKLNSKHIKDLNEYSQIKSFYEFIEYPPFKSKKETELYFKSKIRQNDFKKNFWWSIIYKKNNKAVGTFVFHDYNNKRHTIEGSWGLSPNYQGKGIMKTVVSNMINIANRNKIARIQQIADVNNVPTVKLTMSLGFRIEGIMKNYCFYQRNKKYSDAYLLSYTKNK
tara:strand:+ start:3829 stop:4380 length:552 start_codon:yes stop_codon:yes gene_type:complete